MSPLNSSKTIFKCTSRLNLYGLLIREKKLSLRFLRYNLMIISNSPSHLILHISKKIHPVKEIRQSVSEVSSMEKLKVRREKEKIVLSLPCECSGFESAGHQ